MHHFENKVNKEMTLKVKRYTDRGGKKPSFSRSVLVGNIIFLSGAGDQILATNDICSGVEERMEKIRLDLEEAGSSIDKVVKTTVFLRDINDYPCVQQAELDYYKKYAPGLLKEPPVCSVIQADFLANNHRKVDFDVVAVMDINKPGWEVKKCPMYYRGVKQVCPNVSQMTPCISQSVTVGNLVFISGMDGRRLDTGKVFSDDFEVQYITALDKVRLAMEDVGCTLDDTIKITRYIRNVQHIPTMWRIEKDYYQKYAPTLFGHPPASTFLQPKSLINKESLIEIEAIGVIPSNKTGWEVKKCPWEVRKYPLYYGVRQPFAKSVVVGDLIFLSGMSGGRIEDGRPALNDFKTQFIVALDKIRLAMEEAGSSLGNIVKTTVLLRRLDDYIYLRQIEQEYLKDKAPYLIEKPPASIIVQPQSFANPFHLVAIDAIGIIPK